MKKKIAFVIPSLSSGGAEKSLVSLLNAFDYNQFEVDLYMMNREGLFLQMVPKEVQIIDFPADYKIFSQGLFPSMLNFMIKGKFAKAINRLLFSLTIRRTANVNLAEQQSWKYVRSAIGKFTTPYDAAIGYLEKSSIYFAVDCLRAIKKIGFIRTNYPQLGMDAAKDKLYFDQLDYLCLNGFESQAAMEELFPTIKHKLKVIMNVVSPQIMRQLSEENVNTRISHPNFLSIGRLEEVKGFKMALDAAKLVVEKLPNFQWLIIGIGSQEAELKVKIAESGLSENVFLLGEMSNPYPYIKCCDIFVQTSIYEGRSSTINEAKILCKPIVSTDFKSIFEQLTHQVNGTIVEKTPEAIAEGIIALWENEPQRLEYCQKLSEENLGTEDEIKKLYQLID